MNRGDSRVHWLLAGVVALSAVWAVTRSNQEAVALVPDASSRDTVVAWVGEVPILKVEVDDRLEMAREAGAELTEAESLQEVIDEELWLQGALDDGLLRRHRGLRNAVARRMLDVVIPAAEEPADEELRSFYDELYPPGSEDRPGFERARFRLLNAWRLERDEQALESYLAWLRQDTETETLADTATLKRVLDAFVNEPEASPPPVPVNGGSAGGS